MSLLHPYYSSLLCGLVLSLLSPVMSSGTQAAGPDHFLAKGTSASVWTATSAKGETLRGLVWRAPGRPQGVIVCLHGLQTHSAWYAPMAEHLRSAGWMVIAPDRRDSGMNRDNNLASVKSARQLFDDLDAHLSRAAAEAPGRPLILLGTSWGSNLASAYLASRDKIRVRGLIQLVPATVVRKNLAPNFVEQVFAPVLNVISPNKQRPPTFRDFHYLAGDSQSAAKNRLPPVDRKAPRPAPCDLEGSNAKLAEDLNKDGALLREPAMRTLSVGLGLAGLWKKKAAAISARVPVLILTADHDQIMDNQAACAAFPKGHAAHHTMPAGHGVQITHPQIVSSHVLDWLRSSVKRP